MKVCLVWLTVLLGLVQAQNEWILGKWTAEVDGSIYTLENKSDGTYIFTADDGINPTYRETGTWQVDGNAFTQNWEDPTTGEAQSATYVLEKLSDTAFNQSGGNLPAGFVFSFTKVGTLTPSTQNGNPPGSKPGTPSTPTNTPANPLDNQGDEPATPQTQTAPPQPATDPTVTSEFIVGEWVARERNQLYVFNVRNDGSYTWQISNWNGEVIYSEEAQWELENGRLKQTWNNTQTGLTETAYYEPERVTDTTMRWRGGNFGLHTLLFQRVLPDQLSPRSSWLVGNWTSIVALDTWGLVLQADGTYTLTIIPVVQDGQTFRGNWSFDKETLSLSGDKSGNYTVTYLDNLAIYLSGQDIGDSNLFQRTNSEPRDPYQLQTFAGQYIQATSTLTLQYESTQYTGTWLQVGQPYDIIAAQVDGDTLSFTAKSQADGKEYQHSWRLDNNGLRDTSTYNISAPFFQKISETTWARPSEVVAYWINTEGFLQDDDLLLLADGRFRQTRYFDFTGQVSRSVTEGTYRLENNQLTLDPTCGEPGTYDVKQAQDHLLVSFNGIDGKPVTTTYLATPTTSLDYQLAQAKVRDEIEAKINAEWEQKIPLGPVNTAIGRIPPSNEISVDESPQDVFPDATIFAEQELYPWQSESFYFYDKNGAFRTGSMNMMIIDPGFADQIDTLKGQYYDKFNTYFFPNGRTMTYSETYLDAVKITYPPTPNVKFYWNKYGIEDGKIIVGEGDSQTVYDILDGRRHIRLNEQCYENLKFSTATTQ